MVSACAKTSGRRSASASSSASSRLGRALESPASTRNRPSLRRRRPCPRRALRPRASRTRARAARPPRRGGPRGSRSRPSRAGRAGRRVRVALGLEDAERPVEVGAARARGRRPEAIRPARSCSSASVERIVGELGRLGEVALGLLVRAERRGPLAGARELVRRLASDLGRIGGVRRRLVRGEVVGGDDLDDLLLAQRRCSRGTPRRRGAAPCGPPSPASRRRPCARGPGGSRTGRARASAGRPGRRAPPCGRARTRIGSSSASGCPPSAASACLVNVLPSTAASWTSRRSSAGSPSRRAAIRACSVSGTSSDSIVARSAGRRGPSCTSSAAVEQHPHRLDRVERDALGPREDLRRGARRAARARGRRAAPPSPRRERLEVQRGEVALAGAPGRAGARAAPAAPSVTTKIGEVPRPLEQVLDEVEQRARRPTACPRTPSPTG